MVVAEDVVVVAEALEAVEVRVSRSATTVVASDILLVSALTAEVGEEEVDAVEDVTVVDAMTVAVVAEANAITAAVTATSLVSAVRVEETVVAVAAVMEDAMIVEADAEAEEI